VEPIRILLVDMPRMLREIVSGTISAQPDMQVVAEDMDYEGMLSAAERNRASVVIVGSDGADVEDMCERLAVQRPDLGVLALSADGRHTTVHELRPFRTHLGELSPQQLVEAIRDAAFSRTAGT
jgi:DNA-binding NarL/FixJ family response regulator